jgi:hypothetical protein
MAKEMLVWCVPDVSKTAARHQTVAEESSNEVSILWIPREAHHLSSPRRKVHLFHTPCIVDRIKSPTGCHGVR